MLSAAPDVLANASPKLLYRLGARPEGLGGIEGAWVEYQVNQRLAVERGEYIRVRELSADSPTEELSATTGTGTPRPVVTRRLFNRNQFPRSPNTTR